MGDIDLIPEDYRKARAIRTRLRIFSAVLIAVTILIGLGKGF